MKFQETFDYCQKIILTQKILFLADGIRFHATLFLFGFFFDVTDCTKTLKLETMKQTTPRIVPANRSIFYALN